MKLNRKTFWKILQPWIDFEEGETGDCPELDELLRKIIEHEKSFERELRELRNKNGVSINGSILQGEIERYIQIREVLGE